MLPSSHPLLPPSVALSASFDVSTLRQFSSYTAPQTPTAAVAALSSDDVRTQRTVEVMSTTHTAVVSDGYRPTSAVGVLGAAAGRRKRARHPELWKRNNYRRKVLKDKGPCTCTRRCCENIDDVTRANIKSLFSQLSKVRQDEMLLSLIKIDEKKETMPPLPNTRDTSEGMKHLAVAAEAAATTTSVAAADTTTSPTAKSSVRAPKLFSSKYFVNIPPTSDAAHTPAKLIRVCHYAFLSIHGIGKKRVNNLVSHAFITKNSQPKYDRRGRHSNRANKVSAELVVLAEKHILSFPRYAVRYHCENANDDHSSANATAEGRNAAKSDGEDRALVVRYLSPQLNLVKMYRLFLAKVPTGNTRH